MYKKLAALIIFISMSFSGKSQVFPAEGAQLHYRIIAFRFPSSVDGVKYQLEIAQGNFADPEIFSKYIIIKSIVNIKEAIAEVPGFGIPYTWRVVTTSKKNVQIYGELHHFHTLTNQNVDTSRNRLHITTQATRYKDAYVFSDANKALYDMKGNPVWFLPGLPGRAVEAFTVRDLKMSPAGTITFFANDTPYEINYDGRVLWTIPSTSVISGDTSEHFHHEFTRLYNGNYMVAGNEIVLWEWKHTSDSDSALFMVPQDRISMAGRDKQTVKMSFGTLLEYDKTGKLVWYWKSSDYYKKTDALHHRIVTKDLDTHENAFYFDEKRKLIYISFKGISQLIKIKYPSGEVVGDWGVGFDSDPQFNAKEMFCEEHGLKVTEQGLLYMFNNNVCNPDLPPTVALFREPLPGEHGVTKVWEYIYPLYANGRRKRIGRSGGNVCVLPGQGMFASLSLPFGNLFIVSHDKKIVWNAVLERRETTDSQWAENAQYRASIIKDRKSFEKMIEK